MTDIITAAVTGIFAVIVCLVEVRTARDRKRTEKRAEVRARESRLSMKMQDANTKLAVVTAKAVMKQHTNGDVEEAFHAAEEAQEAYRAFIEEIASQHLTKI